MVGFAFKSVIVLAVAWLAALALRRQSAATRHLVWRFAFALLLSLPLLVVTVPALELPVDPAWVAPDITFSVVSRTSPPAPVTASPGRSAAAPSSPGVVDWYTLLVRAWIVGSGLVFLHLAIAWAITWRIRRSAIRYERTLDIAADRVRILESERVDSPLTAGWLRPVIVLPETVHDWTDEHLRMVLEHELAHVRRGDLIWQSVARLALCLYWWNPLAWSAWKEFVREREQAADDAVLSAGALPSEYASLLLEMARTVRAEHVWNAAALAMARPAQLEGRLMKILDATVNRRAPRRAMAWVVGVCALVLALPLASMRAQQMSPADVDSFVRTAAEQKNHQALDTAARAAERALNYTAAAKMLEASVAIRAQGPVDDRQRGLVTLAEFEQRREHFDRAEALYQQVLVIAADTPEAQTALTNLGVLALIRKDSPTAEGYLSRALAIPNLPQGRPLMWMAVLRERAGDRTEAESFLRRSVDDTTSPEADARRALLAQFLRREGRDAEADSLATPQKRAVLPAPGAGVYRIGGDVTRPNLVTRIEPKYSEEARAAKYQGSAVFVVEIGVDGKLRNIQPLRDVGFGLDQRAIEALSEWKFEPGTKDGHPVPVEWPRSRSTGA